VSIHVPSLHIISLLSHGVRGARGTHQPPLRALLIICFPEEKNPCVMYGNVFLIVYSQERTGEKMNQFLIVLPF
jgi:hypothetical protein